MNGHGMNSDCIPLSVSCDIGITNTGMANVKTKVTMLSGFLGAGAQFYFVRSERSSLFSYRIKNPLTPA